MNVKNKIAIIDSVIRKLEQTSVSPEVVNDFLKTCKTSPISQKTKISNLILRPQVKLNQFVSENAFIQSVLSELDDLDSDLIDSIETVIKYDGYIEKERELAQRFEKYENMPLKVDFDYKKLKSLSYEAREKLSRIRPQTIGQASRISGISPSDISVLTVFIGK
jgi:tRNA uridine 5-carboxymethylaminomethyl modification enzyme